ncbi:MobA/MobL family protein [Inhella sp.]|uniref:MobA/MobL family protein n=1 Tax=Inhella sp. TaxID=1921806 RepID=UPI0035B0D603
MATFHMSIKSGKRGSALSHSDYINRNGKHGRADQGHDLLATGTSNLPEWAEEDPRRFWASADKFERQNGAAYREYEVALPRELSIQQQIDLVERFINERLDGKPSEYAIHSPLAAIGGVPQPHAHIMFSDRRLDGIERSAEQHFRRFNSRNPLAGGAKKDSGGMSRSLLRDEVVKVRSNWADLTNEALALQGHDARVDHRSNKDRGIDAEPGNHLGPAKIRKMKQLLAASEDGHAGSGPSGALVAR